MLTLVTGATGFLGRALVRELADRGAALRVLTRDPERATRECPGAAEYVPGDLADPESLGRAVQGARHVFHLATSTQGPWEQYERETVHGSAHLARAAAAAGVERFLYVSSIWVVDLFGGHDVIDERTPYRTQHLNRYIRSKLLAEQAVLAVARETSLPLVVARPGRLFGPGSPELLSPGFRLGSRVVLTGWRDTPSPTIFLQHAVEALCLLMERGEPGGIYHLVDDQPVRRHAYLRLLRRHYNPRLLPVRVPAVCVGAAISALRLCGRLHPTLAELARYAERSAERVSGGREIRFSNQRLRALGWRQSSPTELNLLRTIRSFDNNREGDTPSPAIPGAESPAGPDSPPEGVTNAI
ncbi:MAG: NAD-dependent epimerase/dehydratase family protein [Armatimonadota bacterium]